MWTKEQVSRKKRLEHEEKNIPFTIITCFYIREKKYHQSIAAVKKSHSAQVIMESTLIAWLFQANN